MSYDLRGQNFGTQVKDLGTCKSVRKLTGMIGVSENVMKWSENATIL